MEPFARAVRKSSGLKIRSVEITGPHRMVRRIAEGASMIPRPASRARRVRN